MSEGHSATLYGSCNLHWQENKLNLVTYFSVYYTNEINSFDCFCQLVGMCDVARHIERLCVVFIWKSCFFVSAGLSVNRHRS